MYLRLFLISSLVLCTLAFRLQGVGVKGKLTCGNVHLRNTKVKIYDIDTNPGDADDLLDEKYTDFEGEFRLDGTTRELTDIDPVLYIYHDCNDGIRPCQKRITVPVPKRYIHRGKVITWFDVGTMDLQMEYPGQDRSCNH